MKKIILFFGMMLLVGLSVRAQTVEVPQTFVDDATKAFDLVVEQKKVIENCLTERKLTDAERDSMRVLIKGFDELIKVKDQISDAKDRIIALYERVIVMYQGLVEKLEQKLLKPKSFFQKFLQAVKETLLLVGGIVIGRGL